jgi:hypothetical protein
MTPQRDLLDETLDAYVAWREECASVRDRYRWSQTAAQIDMRWAYIAYQAALEREEQAAKVYAQLLGHLNRKPCHLLGNQRDE